MPSISTWNDIQNENVDSFRDATGSYIGPDERTRMLRRVLRRLDNPECFRFQETSYTLTLTGAAQYDLDTLIPGWKKMLSLYYYGNGMTKPLEMDFLDPKDFEVATDSYVYTIFQNRYLKICSPGAAMITGQVKILYYTSYMVIDAITGAFKPLPTSGDDIFAIPERFLEVLTEGLNSISFRKDRSNAADSRDAKLEFENAREELFMNETAVIDVPVRSMRGAF